MIPHGHIAEWRAQAPWTDSAQVEQATREALEPFERGTKGGRLRFVAIRNDEQRAALERALPFAPHPSSHLGHTGLTLKQSLKRFDNVMRKVLS